MRGSGEREGQPGYLFQLFLAHLLLLQEETDER